MPRDKGEPPAIRVYTVCDESRCKPMDAEDCEVFTDVYWIKFSQVSHARFAKRKLDEYVFLGNRLQISYAPQFESLSDVKEKLEGRRNEVLRRIKYGRTGGSHSISEVANDFYGTHTSTELGSASSILNVSQTNYRKHAQSTQASYIDPCISNVSSNKEYFKSSSMKQTVRFVRDKLDKITSSSEHVGTSPSSKKTRVDNRRRI